MQAIDRLIRKARRVGGNAKYKTMLAFLSLDEDGRYRTIVHLHNETTGAATSIERVFATKQEANDFLEELEQQYPYDPATNNLASALVGDDTNTMFVFDETVEEEYDLPELKKEWGCG